ncbi:MAG TPA: hypothetical protein G4O12_07850 [Dehalococcoidia bacterium]|nr:hypothetical protein [Dehalococcoidia bacterium]
MIKIPGINTKKGKVVLGASVGVIILLALFFGTALGTGWFGGLLGGDGTVGGGYQLPTHGQVD